MTKGSIVVQIKCLRCGTTVLEVPDGATYDTMIRCENGHEIGHYGPLNEAVQGGAYSGVFGGTLETTFKPVK